LFSTLVEQGKVLTPKDVSEMEVVFERRGGGVFRWMSGAVMGHCDFGASLQDLLQSLPQSFRNDGTGSVRLGPVDLAAVMNLFRNQQYVLWYQSYTPRWYETPRNKIKVIVVLKQGVTPESQLRAWYHALLLARRLSIQPPEGKFAAMTKQKLTGWEDKDSLFHVASSLDLANKTFDGHAQELQTAGWEFDIPVLETRSGTRISCEERKGHTEF
jgi:hypothetical protein